MKAPQKDKITLEFLSSQSEEVGELRDEQISVLNVVSQDVGLLVKISELLRAKIGSNEKIETIVIVTHHPIPEGIYRAKAVSMVSDITAECKLVIKGPKLYEKSRVGN